MKLHENYFNPGPLTDSGFKRLSRCQANLQESDRTSGEPTVNGQSRLMAISGERTPGVERGLAYDSSPRGQQQETYAGNPGSMYFYPDFNPAVFLHRCDLTEFRRRTSFSETSLVRAELVMFYTELVNKISRSGIVEMHLHSTIKRHRRRIFNLTSLTSKTASMVYSIDKTSVRWQRTSGLGRRNHLLEGCRKTIGLKRLNHLLERCQKSIDLNRLNLSLIELGFLCDIKDRLSNSSKLIIC